MILNLNKNTLLLALILSLSVFACIAPGPKGNNDKPSAKLSEIPLIRTMPKAPLFSSIIYHKAERFYAYGNFNGALEKSLSFLADAPHDHDLADNSMFRVGVCYFELGRYKEAESYFETITRKYPNSDVVIGALINNAITQYILNNFDRSKSLFAMATGRTDKPTQRAFISYYTALFDESNDSYYQAAIGHITAELEADDPSLINQAKINIKRLFHDHLSEIQLQDITVAYSSKWSAREAFEELIFRYKQSGDTEKLEEIERLYSEQFSAIDGLDKTGGLLGNENYLISSPKIGVLLPLSGYGSEAGREVAQGLQLAGNIYHHMIREKGISIVMMDSGGAPDTAKDTAISLAYDQETIAILGPLYSSSLEAVAQVAFDYRVPLFSPSASREGLASISTRVFRNTTLDSMEAMKVAKLGADTMGHKRFAVIYPGGPAGRQLVAYFRNELEKLDAEIVAAEPYELEQTDFTSQIKAIGGMTDQSMRKIILKVAKSSKRQSVAAINGVLAARFQSSKAIPKIFTYEKLPLTRKNFRPGLIEQYDAVLIIGPAEKTALILPQLTFFNVKGITKLVSRAANNSEFIKIAERYAEGVYFVDGFFIDSEKKSVRDFVRGYRLAFREEPTRLAAQSFDAMRAILEAIAQGAKTRRQVTDYLSNIKAFDGVSGSFRILPSGDADKEMFYLTVRNGEIVEFNPEDIIRIRELGEKTR